MYETINIEKLRDDLINYYGTALYNSSPLAIIELSKIERSNDEEIIKIAIENNFNLNKYIEYNIYNDYINKSDTRKNI